MKLYLVRHATAVDHLTGGIRRDAERPLTGEGRQEAELMATALKRSGVHPDAYLTSPLVRARQTAEIFAEVLGGKERLDIAEAMAPAGNRAALYKQINALKRAGEVCLFGHMPDVSMLAQALLLSEELDIPFKKAAVCRIDVTDLPPTTGGQLKWMLTPKLAAALLR